jgi:hypothetical protein
VVEDQDLRGHLPDGLLCGGGRGRVRVGHRRGVEGGSCL